MIALCMIVKDEEAVVQRCLQSCKGVVDKVIVSDTGSTDETVARIKSECVDLGLELILVPHKWKNFGHNRSYLMQKAHGQADYLLLLDADMELQVSDPAAFDGLQADAYQVRYTGAKDYAQKLLVSGKLAWKYVGVTHEYITPLNDEEHTTDALVGAKINHHGDGSSRPQKYVRDIALLQAEWDKSQDPRAAFYLAQSFEESGRRDEARELYLARAGLGGWEEERWLAGVRAGLLGDSIEELLASYSERSWRAEPMYYLSVIARRKLHFPVALMFAETGLDVAYPTFDMLFIERWIYDFGLQFERAISLQNCGHLDEAKEVNLKLLAQAQAGLLALPQPYITAIEKNLSLI